MKINKYKSMNCEAIMISLKETTMTVSKQLAGAICFLLFAASSSFAQTVPTRTLGLDEAVQLGIQNSKQLKKSQYKIDEALTRVDQAKDAQLPSATVSFQYLHALMLARTISLPGSSEPTHLPFDLPAYVGTLSVSEPIFSGNKLKY